MEDVASSQALEFVMAGAVVEDVLTACCFLTGVDDEVFEVVVPGLDAILRGVGVDGREVACDDAVEAVRAVGGAEVEVDF